MKIKKRGCFLLPLIFIFFLGSCTDDIETYKFGKVFTNSDSKVGYVDTITVNAYTIMMDSFVTSGFNTVFLGYNNDSILGKTIVETFVPISFNTSIPTISDEAEFDSLVLVLKQNGNYSGDTNTVKGISIYQVTDPIEMGDNESYFYNVDSFAREGNPLATVKFKPKPLSEKALYIQMPDSLGLKWFNWIIEGNDTILYSDLFLKYFKGLVLVPITTDQNWSCSFYGLNSASSITEGSDDFNEVELRLYYKSPDLETNSYISFVPSDESFIFTHYSSDRKGTILENMQPGSFKMPSNKTQNQVFIQSGTGLAIKIEIPLLERIYEISPNITILDANLIISPHKGSYQLATKLPTDMSVYWTDKKNHITGTLTDISGETNITGTLIASDEFDEPPYYYFNVLQFVISKIASEQQADDALILLLSNSTMATTLIQLAMDDQSAKNNSFQLQLYYIKY